MSGDPSVKAYLGEMLGQYEKIRPVVQSGNETPDIILKGKLSTAMDAGIQVDVERAKIPDRRHLIAQQCHFTADGNKDDGDLIAKHAPLK